MPADGKRLLLHFYESAMAVKHELHYRTQSNASEKLQSQALFTSNIVLINVRLLTLALCRPLS